MKKLISKITSLAACTGILLSSQTAAFAETISVDPDYPIHGNKCGIVYVNPEVDRDVYITITQYTPDGDYKYYDTVIPAAGSAAGENNYSFSLEGKDDVTYDIVIGVPKFKSSNDPHVYTYKFTVRDTDDIVDEAISAYAFYFEIVGGDKHNSATLINSSDPAKDEYNVVAVSKEIYFPLADFVRGDVNFSGTIDLLDAIEIAKYMADKSYLSGDRLLAADYDGNGTVDLQDAIGIAKYMAANR